MKQYKNTVKTIQNTVNTSTHITKTPTELSKHFEVVPRFLEDLCTSALVYGNVNLERFWIRRVVNEM